MPTCQYPPRRSRMLALSFPGACPRAEQLSLTAYLPPNLPLTGHWAFFTAASAPGFPFVFASDSHFGFGPANRNTELAFKDIVAHEKAVAFGLVVGDITETGTREEYELFQNLHLIRFTSSRMGAMGNHESKWQDPEGSLLASKGRPPAITPSTTARGISSSSTQPTPAKR